MAKVKGHILLLVFLILLKLTFCCRTNYFTATNTSKLVDVLSFDNSLPCFLLFAKQLLTLLRLKLFVLKVQFSIMGKNVLIDIYA